jgi:hypothetical protein
MARKAGCRGRPWKRLRWIKRGEKLFHNRLKYFLLNVIYRRGNAMKYVTPSVYFTILLPLHAGLLVPVNISEKPLIFVSRIVNIEQRVRAVR